MYFNCQINWLPIIGRKQSLLPKIHAWPPDFLYLSFIIDHLVHKNTSIDHFSSSKHVTIIKQEKWNTHKCFTIDQTYQEIWYKILYHQSHCCLHSHQQYYNHIYQMHCKLNLAICSRLCCNMLLLKKVSRNSSKWNNSDIVRKCSW